MDDCLTVKAVGKKRIPWLVLGIGCIAVLLAFWVWAKATGHWEPEMPPFMYQKIYPMFLGRV